MFKSILVPTDGSEFCNISLKYAIDLAKDFAATIKLFHAVDIRAVKGPFIRDISASMGLIPIVDYQPRVQEILEERGKAALAIAERVCTEAGVSFACKLTMGIISREIKAEAHTVDLVIMGQRGEHAEFGTVLLGSTLEATLRETHKPVLVTPKTHCKFQRVLMAYDGGEVSNDALHVCRDICLERNLPLTVLTVNDRPEEGGAILEEARQYLINAPLQVEYIMRSGHAAPTIMAAMSDYDCGLLIMGAYGRNRFVEMVLGSTTSYILHKATFPVLLSR